ncbi:hypothetical protein [Clostridium perfringens]|uniref:hypothetical protein n=1 Tax=Clostridium perfringens TaxID=1502 RepID=UPI003A1029D5
MREKSRCFALDNRYLANALSFCGFSYYMYDNGKTYKFEDTEELREAINEIIKLRRKYNKYNK